MGYKVAVWRDQPDEVQAEIVAIGKYDGYAISCNRLIRYAREKDADARWFVCAGDDIWPDPHKRAEAIEAELVDDFGGTYGVMQPTGDRWGEDPNQPNHTLRGAYIDRVCASAFIGAEFVDRTYGGQGPLYHGYFHMFVDEELQAVAETLGVLWQRRDLTHVHRHWQRERRKMPEYLKYANSPTHWSEAQTMYAQRKASGFPGAVAIAV
jgi:hypothetical protein